MYSYALYAYMAYRLYEYYSIIEYALYFGRGSVRAYRWLYPSIENNNENYADWVILHEEGEVMVAL